MTTPVNDRFLRALLRQPVDRTPVWMMRQAGRYLPEYRALRAEVPDFVTFCKTPELACQATLQPLARFELDAAIIFSDILVVPAAMGSQLEFVKGEGPVIHNPVRSRKELQQLSTMHVLDELDYVMQAIAMTRKALDNKVPLIGFAGSPWTNACYMMQGGGSKEFEIPRQLLYREPKLVKSLLRKITDATTLYLNAQIEAGAQALMIFDTWGGLLTESTYQEFSLRYMKKIIRGLNRQHQGETIPVVLFTKNGGHWLELMADSGCDALGLDWTTSVGDARQRVGDKVALQGNLDPMQLFASTEQIEQAVIDIVDSYGPHPGHVFNLGHGINKDTPIEGVHAMIDAVQRYGRQTKSLHLAVTSS